MKTSLSFLFLSLCLSAFAQSLQVIPDTVNFGVVYENAPDSSKIFIKNNGVYPVEINRIFGFPFYGDTVVSSSFGGGILAAGDSVGFWVKAQPEHNIKHEGSLVIDFEKTPYGSVIIPYKFQGRYSNNYYAATENKTETSLRTQLKSTIGAGYVSLSYNAARDNMYATLDNVNGDVECVYTGRTATFNSRTGANNNNFNCEHTWPQSLFSSNLPMKSDIHHLFSTDVTANSQRGNLPFGVVSNPSWTVGGSKKNSSTFEPRDSQKGATARSMMYFVLRYQDYSNFFVGQQAVLRQWHETYPPSQVEIARNNGIFTLQNNRSPFVDYPQFSERITSLVGATSAPDIEKIYISVDSIFLMEDQMFAPPLTYNVHVYNYGNTNVNVSNLVLSNSALSFAAGSGTNAVISPGESLTIGIVYSTVVSVSNESLIFQTTVPGNSNVTIPINSINPFGIEERIWNPNLKITNTIISWENVEEDFSFNLLDVAGRTIAKGKNTQQKSIDLRALASGTYLLQLTSAKGLYSKKISIIQ